MSWKLAFMLWIHPSLEALSLWASALSFLCLATSEEAPAILGQTTASDHLPQGLHSDMLQWGCSPGKCGTAGPCFLRPRSHCSGWTNHQSVGQVSVVCS